MKKLLLLAIIALMMILSGCAANMEREPQTPTDKLINAAEAGDKTKVEELLKEGVDVNSQDSYGYTPLYSAASHGKKDVVELLIANGADVNRGENPLIGALEGGYKDIAILLIKNGVNLDYSLHLVAVHQKANIVEFLIDHGAVVNDDALLDAIIWTDNNQKVFDVLIAHVANMNVKRKSILLFTAASHGKVNIVKSLIARGADVNIKNDDGDTPLHLAKRNNYGEVVNILIANGADVNIRNNKGETPEIYANRTQVEDKADYEAVQAKKHAKENEAKHCLSNYDGQHVTTTVTNNCNQSVGIEVISEDIFGKHTNTYYIAPGQSEDVFPNPNNINVNDITKAWFIK